MYFGNLSGVGSMVSYRDHHSAELDLACVPVQAKKSRNDNCSETIEGLNCSLQNKRPRESKFTRPGVGFRFALWIRQISPQIV